MAAVRRRATPLIALLLLIVLSLGLVGRGCARLHMRSPSFLGSR